MPACEALCAGAKRELAGFTEWISPSQSDLTGIWNHGVADEVGEPVAAWLEDGTEVQIDVAH